MSFTALGPYWQYILGFFGVFATVAGSVLAAKWKNALDKEISRKTTEALLAGQQKQAETTLVVKHIDERIDLTHTQQTMFESLRLEFKDFKQSSTQEVGELKAEGRRLAEQWNAQAEELRQTKSALDRANLQIERQAGQITILQDQGRAQKMEYEELIVRLQAENQELRAEVATLRQQVQGNSKDIREIGAIEMKAIPKGRAVSSPASLTTVDPAEPEGS